MMAVILIRSVVFLIGPGGLEASLHTSTYLFLKAPILISHRHQSLLCSPGTHLHPPLPHSRPQCEDVHSEKKKKYNTQLINSISINIPLMSGKHSQGELVQEISVKESIVRDYEWEDR